MVVTNVPLKLPAWQMIDRDRANTLLRVAPKKVVAPSGGSRYYFSELKDWLDNLDWIMPGTEVFDDAGQVIGGKRALFVVDEAHMPIPQRKADQQVVEFLDMHRHHGIDVVFLTQRAGKMHKDTRELAEFALIVKVGWWVRFVTPPMNLFKRGSLYWWGLYDGCDFRVLIEKGVRARDLGTFALYESHEGGGVRTEHNPERPWYKRPSAVLKLALVVVWAWLWFGGEDESATATPTVATDTLSTSVTPEDPELTTATAVASAKQHPLQGQYIRSMFSVSVDGAGVTYVNLEGRKTPLSHVLRQGYTVEMDRWGDFLLMHEGTGRAWSVVSGQGWVLLD